MNIEQQTKEGEKSIFLRTTGTGDSQGVSQVMQDALTSFDLEVKTLLDSWSQIKIDSNGVPIDQKLLDDGLIKVKATLEGYRFMVITASLLPQAPPELIALRRGELMQDLTKAVKMTNLGSEEIVIGMLGETELETNAAIAQVRRAMVNLVVAAALDRTMIDDLVKSNNNANTVLTSLVQQSAFHRDYIDNLDPHTQFLARRMIVKERTLKDGTIVKIEKREGYGAYFMRTGLLRWRHMYIDAGRFLTGLADDMNKEIVMTPAIGKGLASSFSQFKSNFNLTPDSSCYQQSSPPRKLKTILDKDHNIHYVTRIRQVAANGVSTGKTLELRTLVDSFFATKLPTSVKFNLNGSEVLDRPDSSISETYNVDNLVITIISTAKELTAKISVNATAPVIWDINTCYVDVNPLMSGRIIPTTGAFVGMPFVFLSSGVSIPMQSIGRIALSQINAMLFGDVAPLISTLPFMANLMRIRTKLSSLWSSVATVTTP